MLVICVRFNLPNRKEQVPMKSQTRPLTRSVLVAGACMLALASAACGSVDASEAESLGQELSACIPSAQPIALATASSQQAAAFAPKFAIDGLTTTRWSSVRSPDQWLQLDLGKVVAVSSLSINWQTAYSKSYVIESSADGATNWVVIAGSAATKAGVQSINAVASTRYLRIHSREATNYGNVSIVDVQVLGTVDSVCGNLLKGPWAFSSEDYEPPSFDASTVYSVSGNSIRFTYQGKQFTVSAPIPSGTHFKQAVPVVQGGRYRLRLDASDVAGASSTVYWASISGATPMTDYVSANGNGSVAIDFDVTSAPGAAPVIELVNHPISVFPGVGVQDFTVTATLTKIN